MHRDPGQYVADDGPEDGPRPTTADKLTVPEAAERLGVTQDAIRKRIKRGYIAWEKDGDGRVYVWVDRSETPKETSSETSYDTSYKDEVVSELRARVHLLERELSAWQEEARRKDHLLAAALERIPAIEPPEEAPPGPRESRETASDESPSTSSPPPKREEPESRPPWWRRMFGG